jgi:hypothetical protein
VKGNVSHRRYATSTMVNATMSVQLLGSASQEVRDLNSVGGDSVRLLVYNLVCG